MIKKGGIPGLLLAVLFLASSCKTVPPVQPPAGGEEPAGETLRETPESAGALPEGEAPDGEGPEEESPREEPPEEEISAGAPEAAGAEGPEPPPAGDPGPVTVLPPENPAGVPEDADMPEPLPGIPETALPAVPPPEDGIPPLPEPPAIALPPRLPGPVPPDSAPPSPVPPPLAAPPPATPQAEAPPPAAPVPPPPPFIRPAEPELPGPSGAPGPVTPLPELPARTPPAGTGEDPVFSRIVRATAGQLVEVPFRGTGWVFLGELGSRRGINYESRRLDREGQTFVFLAETPGTYALKFYRQDFIRDYIINDYVQVIVGAVPESSGLGWFNPPVDRGRVTAEPRWPPPADPNPPAVSPAPAAAGSAAMEAPAPAEQREPAGREAPAAGGEAGTASPPPPPAGQSPPAAVSPGAEVSPVTAGSADPAAERAPEPEGGEDPADYMRRARAEFESGRISAALAVLDQFRRRFPSGSDEAWWLYGQFLEARGPNRNIRDALKCYQTLVREYPQSPFAEEARRRIAYLERYYFTIQ